MSPEDKDLAIEGLGQEKNKNEILMRAQETDTPVWSLDPRDPNNFMQYEKNRDKLTGVYDQAVDDPMENIRLGLDIGRDQVFNSLGKVMEWAGADGAKDLQKSATRSLETNQAMINKPLEDMNVFDSRFWTQMVPQQVPFMLALAPVGIAGAMGGTAAAGAL